MGLKRVGAEGDALKEHVLSGKTFSSEEEGVDVEGTIQNNGSGSIDGPNDTMDGSGYYSSISNNIPDRGTHEIDSPGEDLPSGHYDGINNNIIDQGSLDNLTAGEYADSGYYSSGTIEENPKNVQIDIDGNTEVNENISDDTAYSFSSDIESSWEQVYHKITEGTESSTEWEFELDNDSLYKIEWDVVTYRSGSDLNDVNITIELEYQPNDHSDSHEYELYREFDNMHDDGEISGFFGDTIEFIESATSFDTSFDIEVTVYELKDNPSVTQI